LIFRVPSNGCTSLPRLLLLVLIPSCRL
jgi:hypothetical protein